MLCSTKKDIAPKVTLRYAQTVLTMEEIAKIYDNNHYNFKINASVVSNMIYFCIFFRIIPSDVEERIIEKIVENRKKHCKYPNKVKDSLYSKYNKTLKDRAEYEDLLETQVLIKEYLDIKDELKYSSSLDLTDYISSEDERDYIAPETSSKLMTDIKCYEGLLYQKGININSIDLELKRIQKKANYISSIYEKI